MFIVIEIVYLRLLDTNNEMQPGEFRDLLEFLSTIVRTFVTSVTVFRLRTETLNDPRPMTLSWKTLKKRKGF